MHQGLAFELSEILLVGDGLDRQPGSRKGILLPPLRVFAGDTVDFLANILSNLDHLAELVSYVILVILVDITVIDKDECWTKSRSQIHCFGYLAVGSTNPRGWHSLQVGLDQEPENVSHQINSGRSFVEQHNCNPVH